MKRAIYVLRFLSMIQKTTSLNNYESLDNIKKEKEIDIILHPDFTITNEYSYLKGEYKGDTPIAEFISKKVLTLPLYSDLSIEEVNLICDIIISFSSSVNSF